MTDISQLRVAIRIWTGEEVAGEGITARLNNVHAAAHLVKQALPDLLDEVEEARRVLCPASADYVVVNGWLCVHVGQCTCSGLDGTRHEPGCGLEPIRRVEDLLRDTATGAGS